MSLLRTALQRTIVRSNATVQRRTASGGAAFNEPTGYLFGEKVHPTTSNPITLGKLERKPYPSYEKGRVMRRESKRVK